MAIGKKIRLNRIFSHASGRLCSVAVDHASGYQVGLPEGLRDLPGVIREVMKEGPDAMTMHRGPAMNCWEPYAGKVPLILQTSFVRPDDTAGELLSGPEDAVRLGADAVAVVAYVYGKTEPEYMRKVGRFVYEAQQWDLPVIVHVYPRQFSPDGKFLGISFEPEHIAWAVRCGIEVGVDVIKVPYTGDVKSYGEIVRSCPVPVVAAGGPKTPTTRSALEVAAGVIAAGAKGLTIGRNIWGTPDPAKTLKAFKAVIHDGVSPTKAMKDAKVKD